MVEPDFTVPGYSNIYVVGDLACYTHNQPEGKPLPGLAPVAIQQGHYVGQSISRKLTGQASVPFEYKDRGSMAVIGRRNAVAQINSTRLSGLTAWLLWAFVHIFHLIGFENRVLVFIQWFWHHLTFRQSSRIITGPDPYPLVSQAPSGAEALNHQREALHPATSFSR
jgi:NADH dehydrogenase